MFFDLCFLSKQEDPTNLLWARTIDNALNCFSAVSEP